MKLSLNFAYFYSKSKAGTNPRHLQLMVAAGKPQLNCCTTQWKRVREEELTLLRHTWHRKIGSTLILQICLLKPNKLPFIMVQFSYFLLCLFFVYDEIQQYIQSWCSGGLHVSGHSNFGSNGMELFMAMTEPIKFPTPACLWVGKGDELENSWQL